MASLAAQVLGTGLLRPVLALNFVTFSMEAWMYALRIPAISKYKVKVSPGATKEEFNAQLPPSVRWPADNYNHLLEQPTQFYAVALVGALAGATDDVSSALAWAYVGARIAHSLVQATSNTIMVRFGLFVTSSFILLGLTARVATYLV